MRKGTFAVLLALTLSLFVTVVGAQTVQADLPQREASIFLEGQEEVYVATRYALPGQFSIWYAAADFEPIPLENGVELKLINNFLETDVFLRIERVGATGDSAQGQLMQHQGDYEAEGWQVQPANDRFVLGDQALQGFAASRDGQMAQVFEAMLQSGTYHISLRYPMEAAEGWGARMHHFALSLEYLP